MDNHEHELEHLETTKKYNVGDFNIEYIRKDKFYCKKCGEIIVKKNQGCGRRGDSPDWY